MNEQKINQKLLAKQLAQRFSVEVANNGQEALDALLDSDLVTPGKSRFDLLLLDIEMRAFFRNCDA